MQAHLLHMKFLSKGLIQHSAFIGLVHSIISDVFQFTYVSHLPMIYISYFTLLLWAFQMSIIYSFAWMWLQRFDCFQAKRHSTNNSWNLISHIPHSTFPYRVFRVFDSFELDSIVIVIDDGETHEKEWFIFPLSLFLFIFFFSFSGR